MAKRVQLRRGTTAQNNAFTGAVGEVSVDTDKDVLVVHDGVTAGGFPVAARANADGTISLIKKDGTIIGSISATGLFNNTLTSTATDQALTAAQGKVLQDNKLDKTAITASGSAPIYACRAWVNFNGVNNTIQGSGNISSITDNGTGDYTINFTTAMQDTNYTISGNATQNAGSLSSSANILSLKNATNGVLANKSTTSFTIVTVDNSSDACFDSNNVSVAVFR